MIYKQLPLRLGLGKCRYATLMKTLMDNES